MKLIDNLFYLKKKYPEVWNIVNEIQGTDNLGKIQIETAKNGLLTMAAQTESGLNYIHSKYDPVAEAEKIISQYKEFDKNKQVLFYGVGLGYHVEEFVRQHPGVSYTLYEPDRDVFYQFLCNRPFSILDGEKLKHLYIGLEKEQLAANLQHFLYHLKEEVIFIVLPTYERIFKEQTKYFIEEFRDKVFLKRATHNANIIFSKRMTINGMKNLPTSIRTPNILHEKPEDFRGKPAILVSAGPSLDYEYENLRYIKENGLAYIFSVGSSINALIEHDIYPDAACTYDGSIENQIVFDKLIERKIDSIPLIYGNIVGHELIPRYPGPMLHFLVARDFVAQLSLKRKDGAKEEYVDSSKSIAVITLQLLYKLGCNPIILVGQNLAFSGDRSYSKEITYVGKLDEKQMESAIVVKDVEGNEIYTERLLDLYRKEMEIYAHKYEKEIDVINTTKGGAHIAGTTYIPLEKVMAERLTEKGITENNWVDKKEVEYDLSYFSDQVLSMQEKQKELNNILRSFDNLLADMKVSLKIKNAKQLERYFNKFDKLFDKLQANQFYVVLIQSMNVNEFDRIMKMFGELRFSNDPFKKAERVIEAFSSYVANCREDMEHVKELIESMHQEVDQYAKSTEQMEITL